MGRKMTVKRKRIFACGEEQAEEWKALHGIALAVGLRYKARHSPLGEKNCSKTRIICICLEKYLQIL